MLNCCSWPINDFLFEAHAHTHTHLRQHSISVLPLLFHSEQVAMTQSICFSLLCWTFVSFFFGFVWCCCCCCWCCHHHFEWSKPLWWHSTKWKEVSVRNILGRTFHFGSHSQIKTKCASRDEIVAWKRWWFSFRFVTKIYIINVVFFSAFGRSCCCCCYCAISNCHSSSCVAFWWHFSVFSQVYQIFRLVFLFEDMKLICHLRFTPSHNLNWPNQSIVMCWRWFIVCKCDVVLFFESFSSLNVIGFILLTFFCRLKRVKLFDRVRRHRASARRKKANITLIGFHRPILTVNFFLRENA